MDKQIHYKSLVSGIIFFAFAFSVHSGELNHKLWFKQPAKYWNSQALHLGNGFIGASFFGGVENEKFALTEGSIWTGKTFGNRKCRFSGADYNYLNRL